MNNIINGREHLYSLSIDPEAYPKLSEHVDAYKNEIKSFHDALKLIDGGTKAFYDESRHGIIFDDKEVRVTDWGRSERDYLVTRIGSLAQTLFPLERDQEKKQCVEQFILNKLLKHREHKGPEVFIESGSHEEAEKHVNKLLEKVQNQKFLSFDEKESKKRSKGSIYNNDIAAYKQQLQERKDRLVQKLPAGPTTFPPPSTIMNILLGIGNFFFSIGRFIRLVWEALFS